MSLNRLTLRLLTIQALTKQPDETTYPTIANDLVFDSRVDPIDFEETSVSVPIIAVYTDNDAATLKDRGSGMGAMERHVDLRIDFALASFSKNVTEDGTNITYALPTTDAEMELLLDLFEAQIWRAFRTPGRKASLKWQKQIVRLESWSSTASRSGEGNNRLAARSIDMRCCIKPDCWPTTGFTLEEPTLPFDEVLPGAGPILDVIKTDPAYQPTLGPLIDAAGGTTVVLPELRRFQAGYHSALAPEKVVLDALALGVKPERQTIHVQQNWNTNP